MQGTSKMGQEPSDWAYYDDQRMQYLAEFTGVSRRADSASSVDISLSLTGPKISGKPFLRRAVTSRAKLVRDIISSLESSKSLSRDRPQNFGDERTQGKQYGHETCFATKFLIPLKSTQNPLIDGFERIGVWISEPYTRPSHIPYKSSGRSCGTFLFLIEVPEIVAGLYMGHVSGYSVIKILAETVLSKSQVDRLPIRLHPFQLMERIGATSLGKRKISVLYRKRLVSHDITQRDLDGKVRTYLSMMAYPLAIATQGWQHE